MFAAMIAARAVLLLLMVPRMIAPARYCRARCEQRHGPL
jgi:hypothetical protein